ncbi:MAG: thioredoxin fold domain-containing protein [Cocleimonas sp.]|nr:thioredoxin fold domain-containing protein [Cocleimonas sp.]
MLNKFITLFCIGLFFILTTPLGLAEENTKEGQFLGAKTATHPTWFKESFLDLEEDVADATEDGKRLVIYIGQANCPYCNQLWSENFAQPDIVKTFRQHFEIVALNLWGDRELITVNGKKYTEKDFSTALSIAYTPTLLFFNEDRKVIHKLEGYLPPKDFRLVLEYIAQHKEKEGNYADFVAAKEKHPEAKINKTKVTLHPEPFFSKPPYDLSINDDKHYLVVFFEEKNCKNCDLLHKKTLKNKDTRGLIKQFKSIQLDRYAKTSLKTPSGKTITAKDWATALNINYLPAMVFFDPDGNEVMRIDTQMRNFHIQSVYDYILSGAYKGEKNFQRYLSARSEKMRQQGKDVDLWKY